MDQEVVAAEPLPEDTVINIWDENLLVYFSQTLKIQTKGGQLQPFKANESQRYLHRKAEEQKKKQGFIRIKLLKCRQWGGCLDPATRVLTADLRWRELHRLEIGDELVACDEALSEGTGKRGTRKMRTATVEKIWRTRKPSYRMTFDDGSFVICSADHRWLSKKTQTQATWRSIGGTHHGRDALKAGDSVRSVTREWGESSFDDGWFGGMIDGEGSFDPHRKVGGVKLAVSQREGPVLERMKAICNQGEYGAFTLTDNGVRDSKFGREPVPTVIIGTMRGVFRVMGLCRPTRFMGMRWWEGRRLPNNGWRRIVSIEQEEQEQELIDIQTSTGTFIANGVVSHNSTYVEGRGYAMTSRSENQNGIVMAHRDDSSTNLFDMIKRFHENDVIYRPVTKRSNAKELVFEVPKNSRYMVHTSGKSATSGVGRSFTLRFVHCSEVAWWGSQGPTTMGGLMEAVPQEMPAKLGTEVFWETTACGLDPLFHKSWEETEELAKDGWPTEWELVFIPWFWHTSYTDNLDEEGRKFVLGTLTSEEKWLLRQERLDGNKVSLGQISWRRQKIQNSTPPPGLTKKQFFQQEYPATSHEAFQATGSHIFDLDRVRQLIPEAPKPKQRYEFDATGNLTANEEGRLRVWKEPDPHRSYVVGADIAEGLDHGDWSAAVVIDHISGEMVATWHGHMHPKQFGHLLAWLGQRYNHAFLAPERNNHGISTVTELYDMEYKRLYVERVVDQPGAKPRKRYGWFTTPSTKPTMVDKLTSLLASEYDDPEWITLPDTQLWIKDKRVLEEMLRFEKREDGTYGAQEGYNDDTLIALAIAHIVRDKIKPPSRAPVVVEQRRVHKPEHPTAHTASSRPSRTWKGFTK